MAQTLNVQCFKDGYANWLYETTPFLPRFEYVSDNQYSVTLNQAYIHNWANGGKPTKISMWKGTVSPNSTISLHLKVSINNMTGAINGAEVTDTLGGSSNFTNLQAASFEGPSADQAQTQVIFVPCVTFTGPTIEEMYLRENVHIWMRGFNQKGVYDQEHPDIGILLTEGTAKPNAFINFRAIGVDPRDDNAVEISVSQDTIQFYVKDCCSDESTESSSG